MEIKQVFEYYNRGSSPTSIGYKFCPLCQTRLVIEEIGNKKRPMCTSCGFVQFQNPSPTVSILIVDKDRVLLGKRAEHPGKGGWAIPSGFVEYHQDFITAGVIEAREETGLVVEIQSIINLTSSFYSPKYHFLSIYLKASVIGGELEAGDDLVEAKWFDLSNEMPMFAFEEDHAMVKMFRTGVYKELPVERRLI